MRRHLWSADALVFYLSVLHKHQLRHWRLAALDAVVVWVGDDSAAAAPKKAEVEAVLLEPRNVVRFVQMFNAPANAFAAAAAAAAAAAEADVEQGGGEGEHAAAMAAAADGGGGGSASSAGALLTELAGPWVALLGSCEGFARACAAAAPAVLRCLAAADLEAKLAIDLLRVLQLVHKQQRSPWQFASEHQLIPRVQDVCVRMAKRPMVAKMASETLRQIESVDN